MGLELYHLTLQRQSNYVHSCTGHFVDHGPSVKRKSRKDYQVCIATETHLELYDVEEGNFRKLAVVPIFATITAMQSLPVETNYSYLILVTDAGNLSLLQFVNDSGTIRLHSLFNEPFARSGVRKLSPQRHLQVDPQGRCIFLSATDRNKLCYQTDFRNNTLNVSSPLEFQRPNRITISTTICDVAFDNPVYASLEIDSSDLSRYLVFYMLDLGLNHVLQQSEHPLPRDAHFIIPVPNLERFGVTTKSEDQTNPFVIIASENKLILKDAHGHFNLQVQLPTRETTAIVIIASTVHKLKKEFFILLQAHNGDLYKVQIKAANSIPKIIVTFFDTIEPSSHLHIFKNGLFMALQEFSCFSLYEFESLGDDTNALTSDEPDKILRISPKSTLENISVLERSKCLNPILSLNVVESTPLTILAQPSLQKLVSGVNFSELITSPLPPNASGIWSIRPPTDPWHRLVFLGLPKSTMILDIEDGTLEELDPANNKFKIDGDQTVFVGIMGERSVIQVCGNSMLHVNYDKKKLTLKSEWLPPAGIKILKATCSSSQLALALSNNEIIYFELDIATESLNEYQERIELPERITDLSIPKTFRCDFLAVGCLDSSVKIIGLRQSDEENFMEVISMQVLTSPPHSLKLTLSKSALLLHIGLDSGVYMRSSVDKVDGQLFDVRTKFLGSKSVKISVLSQIDFKSAQLESEEEDDNDDEEEIDESVIEQSSCAVVHCDKTWLSYEIDELLYVRPLILPRNMSLEAIAEFRTNDLKSNGYCAISSRGSLIIGRVDKFTEVDNWFQHNDMMSTDEEEVATVRQYQGRTIATDVSDKKVQYVIENDTSAKRCRICVYRSGILLSIGLEDDTEFIINDTTCLDAKVVQFGSSENYLVLSTNDMKLKTYLLKVERKDTKRTVVLEFIHDTIVDDKINSMVSFRDKLLVPLMGNIVLYAMGRKQLLKKSISITPPSITKVVCVRQWEDQRVAIGDIHESVTLFLFDKRLNQFISLADDVVKRHVTALEFLDRSTVIGGDRFGNIWVLRVPQDIEKMIDEEYAYFLSKFHKNNNSEISRNIMECPCKLDLANHFYANDIPISFSVVRNLQMSDRTSVIYAGLQGTIGCLKPLVTKSEVEFMHKLQDCLNDADEIFFNEREEELVPSGDAELELNVELRTNTKSGQLSPRPTTEGAFSLVGREHVVYRSYYAPLKGVVDGDFCEGFLHLYPSEQEFLVKKLGLKNITQVKSRLAEIRTNHV
ncbi:LANO_0F15104g1_1 [Lachancea nothofagi CBS 11611]|uniref:LANO_0F15104g1_1 n=1 Tax=Lachancea nothofagi CBS 11611 TaxID=1266666 RepID=A0A1G4KCL8_9SACH|nr:LANO_0F15104g1_1 [Lachancea nothofagi CBS 11611]